MTEKEYTILLGEEIRKRREALNLSLENVCRLVGGEMSKSSLSLIETGGQRMSVYQFMKLQRLFGTLPKPELD